MYFDYLNKTYANYRVVITLCFVFGFTVLGLLSVQVFLRVLLRLVGV